MEPEGSLLCHQIPAPRPHSDYVQSGHILTHSPFLYIYPRDRQQYARGDLRALERVLGCFKCIIKPSRATSSVKWLNGEKTNVSRTEIVLQYPEDENRDGPRNVDFFAIQLIDAAGSPRRFYYT
jgi:hypothetical protein